MAEDVKTAGQALVDIVDTIVERTPVGRVSRFVPGMSTPEQVHHHRLSQFGHLLLAEDSMHVDSAHAEERAEEVGARVMDSYEGYGDADKLIEVVAVLDSTRPLPGHEINHRHQATCCSASLLHDVLDSNDATLVNSQPSKVSFDSLGAEPTERQQAFYGELDQMTYAAATQVESILGAPVATTNKELVVIGVIDASLVAAGGTHWAVAMQHQGLLNYVRESTAPQWTSVVRRLA